MASLSKANVTILVGENGREREFVVRKDLISLHSGYFKAACYGGFLEDSNCYINFREEKADTFEYFLRWMYEDEPDNVIYAAHWLCRSPIHREGSYEETGQGIGLYEVLKFWRLANRLCAPTLKNFLVDVVRRLGEDSHELLLTKHVRFVLNHTLDSDPLRKIVMDQVARVYLTPRADNPIQPHDNLSRLLRKYSKVLLAEGSFETFANDMTSRAFQQCQSPDRMRWSSPSCLYHYHGIQNGGECAAGPEEFYAPTIKDVLRFQYRLERIFFRRYVRDNWVEYVPSQPNKPFLLRRWRANAEDIPHASVCLEEVERLLSLAVPELDSLIKQSQLLRVLEEIALLPNIPRDKEFIIRGRCIDFVKGVEKKLLEREPGNTYMNVV